MITQDEIDRTAYELRRKQQRDERWLMEETFAAVRAEGLREGIEQGRELGIEQGIRLGVERGELVGRIGVLSQLLGRHVEIESMSNEELTELCDLFIRDLNSR